MAPNGQTENNNRSSPTKPLCVESKTQPNKAPETFPFYKAPINQLCESPVEKSTRGVTLFQDGLTDQGYFDLKFYHNKLW